MPDIFKEMQENTDWVGKWIINDPEYYYEAQEKAREGVRELESFLLNLLQNAQECTVAWYVAQEMTPADYSWVDWNEIREDLLS
jgi:hypothetical protein